jgi:hypothetical protein
MQSAENKRQDPFLIAEISTIRKFAPHFRTPILPQSMCWPSSGHSLVLPALGVAEGSGVEGASATRHCLSNRHTHKKLKLSLTCTKQAPSSVSNRHTYAFFVISNRQSFPYFPRVLFGIASHASGFGQVTKGEDSHPLQKALRQKSRSELRMGHPQRQRQRQQQILMLCG